MPWCRSSAKSELYPLLRALHSLLRRRSSPFNLTDDHPKSVCQVFEDAPKTHVR